MKLCRIGNIGNEKPALIDNENNYRDLSSVIDDLNPETLNFDTIEKTVFQPIHNSLFFLTFFLTLLIHLIRNLRHLFLKKFYSFSY